MYAYLFFGPPGSGKGTQGKLVNKLLADKGASHLFLETGQLLRDTIAAADTPVRRCLAAEMKEGGLVPSVFPATMWVTVLLEEKTIPEHVIIDGAGRKPAEARMIVELLNFFLNMHMHVFFIDVPDDEVVTRMLARGRVDDKEDVIRHRLSLYRDNEEGTHASIAFLRICPDVVFHDIDGLGSVEEVFARIRPHITV